MSCQLCAGLAVMIAAAGIIIASFCVPAEYVNPQNESLAVTISEPARYVQVKKGSEFHVSRDSRMFIDGVEVRDACGQGRLEPGVRLWVDDVEWDCQAIAEAAK